MDEFTEKKSRFIGAISPAESQQEAMEFIKKRREEEYDARHTVWAYLLKDGAARYSDDGEPQGTGGQPVLEVLKRSGVCDAVIGVTRYFGGILLGAGGLTRAYSNGAAIALKSAEKIEISSCFRFSVLANYNHFQNLERIMKENDTVIVNTEFTDKVLLNCLIRSEDYSKLEEIIKESFSATVVPDFIGECYGKMPQRI
ncbi:MAG: YigZ family protein [Oscillospiraceae bacterium]